MYFKFQLLLATYLFIVVMVFVDISITKDELSMIPSVCPPGFVVQFESSLYLFILMQQYI